eukprot:12406744-Karenia_brevis.AAC.1
MQKPAKCKRRLSTEDVSSAALAAGMDEAKVQQLLAQLQEQNQEMNEDEDEIADRFADEMPKMEGDMSAASTDNPIPREIRKLQARVGNLED